MTSFSSADFDEATRVASNTMAIEAAVIEQTRLANAATIPAALRLLSERRGKVVVTGLGKSGHIGRKIAATLSSVGTPAVFIHSSEALHGDSGAVCPGDVMIGISNSGETEEVCSFALMASKRSVPTIAITKNTDSTLSRLSKVTLQIVLEAEADPLNVAPTASTAATLALGDALASGMMHLIGFTHDDFHQFHPGGSLGALLAEDGAK